jgi:hypothetical protein
MQHPLKLLDGLATAQCAARRDITRLLVCLVDLVGAVLAPGAPGDYNTMEGLIQYMNNEGAAKDGRHVKMNYWFFW